MATGGTKPATLKSITSSPRYQCLFRSFLTKVSILPPLNLLVHVRDNVYRLSVWASFEVGKLTITLPRHKTRGWSRDCQGFFLKLAAGDTSSVYVIHSMPVKRLGPPDSKST